MKNRFIGDTRIPSFNDADSTIDLTKYSETIMPEYAGFEFLYITILDVSQYTTTSNFYKQLKQYSIRFSDGESEARQEMQDSYTLLDWDVDQGAPPQFIQNEDGDIEASDIINGRRRTRGAIERDAKFIPIAVYKADPELSDQELYQRHLEASQLANNLVGSVRHNKKDDYIMTGVDLIRNNGMSGNSADVLAWLEDRMNYKKRFQSANTQKEILNKIVELGNANYELTTFMDNPLADAWVIENGYKVKDSISGRFVDKNLIVRCVDNLQYADRIMADYIIPTVLETNCTDPVKIILFSKKRKPVDIKKNTKNFGDALENAYQNCFNLVGVIMPTLKPLFANGNIPEERPWIIKGCIPQISGEQNLDAGKLIPYELVIPKDKAKKVSNH